MPSSQTATPTTDTVWLAVGEAATVSHRHPETIREACRTGDLHGAQRAKRGPWVIKAPCLDAFIAGERCEHQRRGDMKVAR